MNKTMMRLGGYDIPVYTCNTVIVGSGAAGYNAADRLHRYGQTDIAMVTEGVNTGTSRNTGSDKQTYYKLTLSGDEPDSVREMAQTLFEGQCVDGDHALCEAALSADCFVRLAELGVPFPRNRYGEYVGYKTDHDPRRRATSAGPYTSKIMTERLQKAVEQKNIAVFDRLQAIKLLTDNGAFRGILCLDLNAQTDACPFVAFCCKNVVLTTGGPAGMYADSVYPHGHYGASGMAFEAGVKGKNLTEWQFGLASTRPRWNVSGTYMQALPRFISTDKDGGDEREFLYDFFAEEGHLLDMVFLKGYQWPFDVRKIAGGSSVIDILVYLESEKGRRVFLDYRENPGGRPVNYGTLCDEARVYLEKAGACFGTPLQRLLHMNSPAVEFYRARGVNLAAEPLEIALCAQHNNGGLDIDCWWQTGIPGVFAAGEAAASHGVYRPGGSALNAGQAGSTRAAQYIAACRTGVPQAPFGSEEAEQIGAAIHLAQAVMCDGEDNIEQLWRDATRRMSRIGGPIRELRRIAKTALLVEQALRAFENTVRITHPRDLCRVFRLRDTLLCQLVYLKAMEDYALHGGKSRGSALYTDLSGKKPYGSLPDAFTFCLDDGSRGNITQEALYTSQGCSFSWRTVRPIPKDDDFFENVWRDFRENSNIY